MITLTPFTCIFIEIIFLPFSRDINTSRFTTTLLTAVIFYAHICQKKNLYIHVYTKLQLKVSEWKQILRYRYLALTWLIRLITKYFSFEMYFSDHYEIHVFNFSSFDIIIRWFGPVRIDSSLEGKFYGRPIFWEKSLTQAHFP